MGKKDGTSYRAIDVFDRTVFFKSIARKSAPDTFVAKNAKGEERLYRVRHRKDGPAIIDVRGNRRWFVNGVEITRFVEPILSDKEDIFETGFPDFKLRSKTVNFLKLKLPKYFSQ